MTTNYVMRVTIVSKEQNANNILAFRNTQKMSRHNSRNDSNYECNNYRAPATEQCQ